MKNVDEILREHIKRPESSWSMGSYGAVAEFFQDADEALDRNANDELVQITPRGGIRLEANDDLGICAYKITGSDGNSQQHIALCLPEELSRMSANDVLTELGPDCAALSDDACDDTLFDLGVSSVGSGAFQLDFCIRSGDAGLIDFLRDHCGSSIFEHGSPVFGRLMEAQPHRVAVTRLGRIEVYQEIGGEQSDDKTPEGPHTHLLPELLSLNLTHSTDTPIKDGWVPCAFLYPDSTVLTDPGEAHQ